MHSVTIVIFGMLLSNEGILVITLLSNSGGLTSKEPLAEKFLVSLGGDHVDNDDSCLYLHSIFYCINAALDVSKWRSLIFLLSNTQN